MRGLRSTLAFVVILAGLFAYIYFVTWKKTGDDTTKQERVFASLTADKINEVEITSASGDKTTLKKDGAWQVVAPTTAKADEAEMSAITNGLSSLEVTRVIDENPTDLKEYGLAKPRIEVAFKAEGDKDYRRLLIGEKSPTGGDLFASRGGEKRVFLVPAFQESTFNRTTFELRDKTVLKFDREKVDRIEVTAAGKTLEIAKDGGEWKLVKPVATKADFGSVEGLVGRLQTVQMKSIAAAEPTPADLKKDGLDKPEYTVRLNLGSAQATLLIGGKADDGSLYARDGSKPAVMTVEAALADDLKKDADTYRRKDIFEFRSFNANRIDITRGNETVAFERVKGEGANASDKWRRIGPSAKDADKDAMDSLLSRLSNMRAASFVPTTAKTGLDAPAMVVVVKFDDGKKEERVSFGKHDQDVFAGKPGEAGAAKIDATDFSEANKKVDELAK